MKKKLLLVCMAFLGLLTANAQIPTTSTTGNDVWYFIKAQRGASATALWATAKLNNSTVLHEDLALSDAQLWKVVTNGTGVAIVNKAYGTYLNADISSGTVPTIATLPTKALKFTASTQLTNAVYVENSTATGGVNDATVTFRLHAGGDPSGWYNYTGSITDNVSFLFVAEAAADHKAVLLSEIAKATTLNTIAVEGLLPGQYPTPAKSNLTTAIAAAQAVYNGTPDLAASRTAISDLQTAVAAFNATVNPTTQKSELFDEIALANNLLTVAGVGTAPGQYSTTTRDALLAAIATAQGVYDNAASTNADYIASKSTLGIAETTINEVWYFIKGTRGVTPTSLWFTANLDNSRVLPKVFAGTDAQLWKLVVKGTGLALVNKAYNTYFAVDNGGGTTVAVPTKKLKLIVSTYLTGAYLIQSTVSAADYSVHNSGSGSAYGWSNYNGGADNCSFKFLDASQALASAITDAQTAYTNSPAGSNPGQYLAANKAIFQTAITAAVGVKDKVSPVSTQAEILAATTALASAQTAFLTSATNPFKYSTGASTTWYAIKNVYRSKYFKADAIGNSISGADLVASDAAYLWKIVDSGNGAVSIISNSTGGHITIPAANSTPIPLTATPQTWTLALLGYGQFNINGTNGGLRQLFMDAAPNFYLITYPGGLGGAATWVFEEVSTITSVASSLNSEIKIAVVNRKLIVSGTTDVAKAYALTGCEVNTSKELKPGIYIVKVAGKAMKVIVQ